MVRRLDADLWPTAQDSAAGLLGKGHELHDVDLPVALAGSAGFILAGLSADGLPPFSSGYVSWPAVAGMAAASSFGAPLGAAIAHHAPTRGLRRALAILLMIVGLEMLLS